LLIFHQAALMACANKQPSSDGEIPRRQLTPYRQMACVMHCFRSRKMTEWLPEDTAPRLSTSDRCSQSLQLLVWSCTTAATQHKCALKCSSWCAHEACIIRSVCATPGTPRLWLERRKGQGFDGPKRWKPVVDPCNWPGSRLLELETNLWQAPRRRGHLEHNSARKY
jgi:hypothetical protein